MSIDETHSHEDPAFEPLSEAGQGESEGFELAEEELIEHASHGDEHGTSIITQHAEQEPEEEDVESVFGEADEELRPDA